MVDDTINKCVRVCAMYVAYEWAEKQTNLRRHATAFAPHNFMGFSMVYPKTQNSH